MTWYRIRVTVQEKERVRELFFQRYAQAGTPEGASLLASDFFSKGLYSVYFPPAALPFSQDIIAHYSGEPCDAPPREGTGLECGEESDLELLS